MSFWGSKKLAELLKNYKAIEPFCEDNIKNGAYELCLGDQVFQTDSKPREVKNLNPGQEIYIAPGQFALLLTKETVNIPEDKIAFISIKASIKFKGLVNVSGFHVDPGFEGKLLFSVYNAGSLTIVLKSGQKCFPMWLADLNEKQDYSGEHEKQSSIPLDPITALSQGDLASPSSLLKKITDDYKTLDTKITDDYKTLDTKFKQEYEKLDTKLNSNDEVQKNRIGLLEKEQKAIDYLVKIVVGLGIVILSKFAFDWAFYRYGVDKGIDLKQKEVQSDSLINQTLIEKQRLLIEIDSLLNLKDSLSNK